MAYRPNQQYQCVIFGKHDPLAKQRSYDHQILWSSLIVNGIRSMIFHILHIFKVHVETAARTWLGKFPRQASEGLGGFQGFVIFSGEYPSQSPIRVVVLYLFQSYHFEIINSWKKSAIVMKITIHNLVPNSHPHQSKVAAAISWMTNEKPWHTWQMAGFHQTSIHLKVF